MGARPLGRVIEDKIKIPLSKKILFENVPENSLINIDYVDEEFSITINKSDEVIDENLPANTDTGVDGSGLIVLDQFKPQPN